MKQFWMTIACVCIVLYAQSQAEEAFLDFDDSTYLQFIEIDTISNPSNIWQVGKPNKTNFNSAVTLPNVIVTDTVNPYPMNDTSVFYIHYVASFVPGGWTGTAIQIEYRVDADSGSDFGYIEFSPDNGETWVNYMTDTVYSNCYYMYDTLFTGYTESWEYSSYYNDPWCFGMEWGDSMMYRFTFISDSVQSNKDGWMIDNINLFDMWEGIEENSKILKFHIFPNPAQKQLSVLYESKPYSGKVSIYNQSGQLVKSTTMVENSISVSGLESGLYIIGIMTEQGEIRRKFIVSQ